MKRTRLHHPPFGKSTNNNRCEMIISDFNEKFSLQPPSPSRNQPPPTKATVNDGQFPTQPVATAIPDPSAYLPPHLQQQQLFQQQQQTQQQQKLLLQQQLFNQQYPYHLQQQPATTMMLLNHAKPCAKLAAHSTFALKCRFKPDGLAIATTSADETTKLWSVTNHKLVCFDAFCHK